MNLDCLHRWPVENQSIKNCFAECYEHIFVVLPPFVSIAGGKSLVTLWDVRGVASYGQLKKWSEVAKAASIKSVSDLNRAMLYTYEFKHILEYEKPHEALRRYCEEHNVVWPDEGHLDPYTASAVARVLYRHSYNHLVLDFHGITQLVAIRETISPSEFPSMEKFHPMQLYTENRELLLTSYHEFYYYLLASNDQSLISDIVHREKLEGFFAEQDEKSNWLVPDNMIMNTKNA